MSSEVELLRRAAALMRERAQDVPEGPWMARDSYVYQPAGADVAEAATLSDRAGAARYFASWHPAVALAVADWLDRIAEIAANPEVNWALKTAMKTDAVMVARAYLGESDG